MKIQTSPEVVAVTKQVLHGFFDDIDRLKDLLDSGDLTHDDLDEIKLMLAIRIPNLVQVGRQNMVERQYQALRVVR